MKYQGCLLAVQDIAASKHFYQEVLGQRPLMDMGTHVTFEGFSLQQGYAELIGVQADRACVPHNSFQLYFEVEDLDAVHAALQGTSGLQWVHEIKEYPWGQRDFRVYDPDGHIVEIAEDMGVVVKRFLGQGMSAQAVAERTMFPIAFVAQYV